MKNVDLSSLTKVAVKDELSRKRRLEQRNRMVSVQIQVLLDSILNDLMCLLICIDVSFSWVQWKMINLCWISIHKPKRHWFQSTANWRKNYTLTRRMASNLCGIHATNLVKTSIRQSVVAAFWHIVWDSVSNFIEIK